MVKKSINKILCLSLSISMICPYMTARAQAQYATVELITNGGFEISDFEGFPEGWRSNGKNLLFGGDFETGNDAISRSVGVGNAVTGEALRWATPTNTNDLSIVNSEADEQAAHGNYYAKMSFTKSNWGGLGYNNLPDTAANAFNVAYGGKYLFKADYKVSSSEVFTTPKMAAYYLMDTASAKTKNVTRFEKVFYDSKSVPSQEWQEFSTDFTVVDRPADENLEYEPPHISRFQFRYNAGPVLPENGDSADLYVDNIRLEKLGRVSGESYLSGTKSLKIVGYADTEDEIWISDTVSVAGGEELVASAKVFAKELDSYTAGENNYEGKVCVFAVFDNGDETELGSITQASDEYVEVSDTVTVPDNASKAQIKLAFTGSGTVYADDVSIKAEREEDNIVIPEGYENILTNGGFESYDNHDFPIGWISDGKNMIINGDFETNSLENGKDLSGTKVVKWAKNGSVLDVSVSENALEDKESKGNYSMMIPWTDIKWGGAEIRNDDNGIFHLSYGNSYILRADVKSGKENDFTAAENRFQFNVIPSHDSKDRIIDKTTWIPNTAWQEFSEIFSMPEKLSEYPDTAFAKRFQIRSRVPAVADAVMYVDNISFEKTSRTDTAEYVSGSRSLRIDGYSDADNADEVWSSAPISVNGGEDIYFGLSYKQDSIDNGAGARLVFTNASGDEVSASEIDFGTGSKLVWQNRTQKVTAPKNAVQAQIDIYVKEGKGTLWTDDAFIYAEREEEHENIEVPGSVINVVTNNGFENVDDRMFPTGWTSEGKNLFVNGDFEQEGYWYASGSSASGTREFAYSSDSPDGTTSGNLKWTTATGNEEWGCISYREGQGTPAATAIAVALDSDYYVSMDAKLGDNIKDNNVKIMAELKNGDNQWAIQTLLSKTADNAWGSYAQTYHTPLASAEKNGNNPDVSNAYIYYVYAGRSIGIPTEGSQTQLWIDNLRLEKLGRADSEEYVSGEKSLKVVGYTDGADEVWESDDILEVSQGEAVYYGGKAKLSALEGYARFKVSFYDDYGTLISSNSFSAGRGTKEWSDYSDCAIAPPGASYAKLSLVADNGSGTAWFDDVLLGKQNDGIYASKVKFSLDELSGHAGDTLTAQTTVYNNADSVNVMLGLAIYNNGLLTGIDIQNSAVYGNATPMSVSVSVPELDDNDLANCTAKAFLWNADTYEPIRHWEALAGSKTMGGITMSSAYGDDMVFQQGKAINISGVSAPDETITVSLGSNKQTATSNSSGDWSVTLPAMTAGGPYSLAISDTKGHSKAFGNIMVGEVWLVSGQSNMQYALSSFKGLTQYAEDNDMLRLFSVPRTQEDELTDTLSAGDWKRCTKSVATSFSAVGYLLGKELSEAMPGVAIGIVESSFAGSHIGEWMDAENTVLANVNITDELRSKRYNSMIYPLRDFNYAGVAWYQGESDRNWLYQVWLETMVNSWRDTFKQPNLDFAVVQLPRFGNDQFAIVREEQRLAAEEDDHIHLSVNIDLGEQDNVHPSDKVPLVKRLANVILKEVYGRDIDCYGPKFKSVAFDGEKAIVTFDNADGLTTTDGNAPREFIIAGSDGKFVEATAAINNGKVELTAPGVSKPMYVRYAFEGYPEPNLVGGNGLPAEPFRTDSIKAIYPF